MRSDYSQQVEGPDIGAVPEVPEDVDPASVLAWEEIAAGRFKPRRIRGSCRGRELG